MGEHRYSRHDWRLFKAVANFAPLRDGCIEVKVFRHQLEVTCYGQLMFRANRCNGYWEAATWGSRKGWWFEKVNACLHAVNADVRLYLDGGRFGIVNANGKSRWFRDSFNSEVFK